MARKKKLVHRGVFFDRTKVKDSVGEREKIFASAWEKENEVRQHIPFNPDCSILEALISRGGTHSFSVSQETAAAVATIVQWLATPIGFGFLERTLRTAGYKIVQIKK